MYCDNYKVNDANAGLSQDNIHDTQKHNATEETMSNLELNGRMLDYCVQTNFVAFILMFKIGEYKAASKYIKETKRYVMKIIETMFNESQPVQNHGKPLTK